MQLNLLQLPRQLSSAAARHVDEDHVLHRRSTQLARTETLREFGRLGKLIPGDSSAQHRRPDVREPRLLLRVYAHVVAIDVRRKLLILSSFQLVAQSPFELATKTLLSPSLLEKEMLQPRALAIFP